MNTIRKIRSIRRIDASQLLYYSTEKGSKESKKCSDLKAIAVPKPDKKKPQKKEPPKSKDQKRVTLIQGDGVGCELTTALRQVFESAKVPVKWEVFVDYKDCETNKISPKLVESLKRNKVGIKGPMDPVFLKQLRKAFDLYAFVAVCRNLKGQKSVYDKLDCVVIRDVIEGEYSGIEHNVVPGILQSIKVCTSLNADRIARYVFKYAKENQRKKITVAHKANIMQLTDGNFLESMRQEATKHFGSVTFEERYMDTACLNLVMQPGLSDVLVASSMYGDVLVMMASGIMGGKSLCPGFGVSKHGLIYDTLNKINMNLAGKDIINPTGMFLSAALMLRTLKLNSHADIIQCAVEQLFQDTDIRTPDVGGTAKCSELTKAVCDIISNMEE
ncbi:probable isocitrate dehydrogenase [NAD] subunit alpha, mitochondrial [Drosophila grimshawi]|uniref:isocitrate dehydrogenase (NAD(+)) n=1 Tax=Drosophila grimshawi TaxID=7222 RepID=B4J4V5_DROGR|nr:probable isocitrate dehydrogenase [NAD] subunit alpha, mitochondrial [Drosophila grimshawi]EDW00651.1 GH20895 [Drosophila grimshawi]